MYKDMEKRRRYIRRWNAENADTINAKLRAWRAERRAWAEKQLGGKCAECGATDDLHFDHIDPSTKQYPIASILNSLDKLRAELPKCQLLCAACHRQKTRTNGEGALSPAQHGGAAMYTAHGCRCEECRAWKRSYDKAWREKRRLALAA